MQDATSSAIPRPYPIPCPPICCGPLQCSCCADCSGAVDCSGLYNPPYVPLRKFNISDLSGGGYSYPYITGPLHYENEKYIMKDWNLLFDGKIRENELTSGVLNYVEKYVRTTGNAQGGLYCYNFGLTTDPRIYQPTGAINLTPFHHIAFDYKTISPPPSNDDFQGIICDASGDALGVNVVKSDIYQYNYDMHIMEERYNMLTFDNGHAVLKFTRAT